MIRPFLSVLSDALLDIAYPPEIEVVKEGFPLLPVLLLVAFVGLCVACAVILIKKSKAKNAKKPENGNE